MVQKWVEPVRYGKISWHIMAYPGVAGLLPSANLSHYFQDFVCPARTCKAAQVAILTLNAFASAKHTQMPPVCLELVNWASRAGHYLITLLPGGADVHPWEKEFLQALEMVGGQEEVLPHRWPRGAARHCSEFPNEQCCASAPEGEHGRRSHIDVWKQVGPRKKMKTMKTMKNT